MNATPGPILPKICDWMLNKNYESHTRSQTIGNRFQFPSFRQRVKAITRESRGAFSFVPLSEFVGSPSWTKSGP